MPDHAIPPPAFCESRVRTTREGIRVTCGAGQVELTVNHAWLAEPLELVYTPAVAMDLADKLRAAAMPWVGGAPQPVGERPADTTYACRVDGRDCLRLLDEHDGTMIRVHKGDVFDGWHVTLSPDDLDRLADDCRARAAWIRAKGGGA